MDIPRFRDLVAAHRRIRPHIRKTPILSSSPLNRQCGHSVYLKCEHLQKAGAFKFRGAANAVLSLSDEMASRGVATHSSGNHARALALAALERDIPSFIVMPENASPVKVAAVKKQRAEITFCESTLEGREASLEQVVQRTGAHFIPPYNDPRIISGQGTAAIELLEACPDLDVVLAPVGGGGLLSGTAIAAKSLNPDIRVIGVEPEEADDAFRSFRAGKLIPSGQTDTVADGLRTSLGDLTFACIRKYVDDIITVSEKEIVQAMQFMWEETGMRVEASSSVPVAALLNGKIEPSDQKVGLILSGGNVDPEQRPWRAGE